MAADNTTQRPGESGRNFFHKRFTRAMSVRNKMLVNVLILFVPLVALGYFYVSDVQKTLSSSNSEVAGLKLIDPLTEIAMVTVEHSEAQARGALGVADVKSELQSLEAEGDKDVAWLRKVDQELGNMATHALAADIEQGWQGIKAMRSGSFDESVAAHSRLLDAAFKYRDQVGADYRLVLDPDMHTYPLIDATIAKFPELNRALGKVREHLAAYGAHGRISAAEAARVEAAMGVADDRLDAVRTDIELAKGAFPAGSADLVALQAVDKGWESSARAWVQSVRAPLEAGTLSADAAEMLVVQAKPLAKIIMEAEDGVADVTNKALGERVSAQRGSIMIATSLASAAILLAIFMIIMLSMRVSGAIQRLLGISQKIADGDFDNRIDITGDDELSRLFAGMDAMQRRLADERERERQAVERERQTIIVNERVRQGLDSVDTCVMLADEKHNIIFVNKRLIQTLGAAQADIRKSLPGFDVHKLVGSNMDAFHKSPGHQRGMVDRLSGSHVVSLDFIGHVFRLTATPVKTEDGQRIGTVVEWLERSQEVAIEKEVEGIVGAVIEGDLTRRIGLEGKAGFFLNLSKGINGLVDNVAEVVTQVKSAAHEVNRGASEISTGNANLAQRTEEQASSLEETASSMEQMTSTVKQNADNAGQANQLAVAARDQADKGGAVVARAVRAMGEINASSKKIADIISVIDEIAFQTNLLALNAAVEAARAGEQGRGFAVVASEVRSLAGRSASAAKEIKELIQDSVRKVDEGSELVTQSGATLDQIVSAVKKVGDIVAEIAAASQEQSAGIEQVNKAVMQLDELTQQNAALVEEATAASQSMADQAQNLNELMARYEVAGAAGSVGVGRPAGRPAATAAAAPKVERRAATRPWSGKQKAAPAATAAAARAAASASESEWSEF